MMWSWSYASTDTKPLTAPLIWANRAFVSLAVLLTATEPAMALPAEPVAPPMPAASATTQPVRAASRLTLVAFKAVTCSSSASA